MKNGLVWRLALTTLHAGALLGQTFTGTWQGVLKGAPSPMDGLRLVVKISITDADKLTAQFFSIDEASQPLTASSVIASGLNLKISVDYNGGTYDGKLSPDGSTIDGTWTQDDMRMLLTLTRATSTTAWTIPKSPPPRTMNPDAKPGFEVATIKPSDPSRPDWALAVNQSGGVYTHNTTVADLMKFAYEVNGKQIVGAPRWFDTEKFDINAKPDSLGLPTVGQMRLMFQDLLVDRFSVAFHRDTQKIGVYAIMVVKGGAKIQKEVNYILLPSFGGRPQSGFGATNSTMAEFATVMSAQFLDRPVLDRTGLGNTRYTFVLKFTPDPGMRPFGQAAVPSPSPDLDSPPDLYAAMEQQLGLHMAKTKARISVMIIDKIAKPTPN